MRLQEGGWRSYQPQPHGASHVSLKGSISAAEGRCCRLAVLMGRCPPGSTFVSIEQNSIGKISFEQVGDLNCICHLEPCKTAQHKPRSRCACSPNSGILWCRVTSSWREERAMTALQHRRCPTLHKHQLSVFRFPVCFSFGVSFVSHVLCRECGWASEQDLEELRELEEAHFDNSHPASPCGFTHGGKPRPRPGYSCKVEWEARGYGQGGPGKGAYRCCSDGSK